MHALVTGGGGFLGGYIVEALVARGDKVRSLGRGHYPQLVEQGVEVVRGDIRDPAALAAACQGIECVFHTAAIAGIGMDRNLFDSINRTGTELLLAYARAAGARRFVHTSSPSVVFAGRDQCDVDETAPYEYGWMNDYRAYYSYSKAMAEQAVLAANDDDFRTCALRPHLIWGPGDTHLVPRLLDRARRGRLRRIGDGTNLVDITYVENAAEAHLLAADALLRTQEKSPDASNGDPDRSGIEIGGEGRDNAGGRAYFISQGEAVNCWEWIDDVLAMVDLPPVSKAMTLDAASRVGSGFETLYRFLGLGGEPPMTRFLAEQLAHSHWFDIGAARRDLGYHPRVSTAEGMQRMGGWLRKLG